MRKLIALFIVGLLFLSMGFWWDFSRFDFRNRNAENRIEKVEVEKIEEVKETTLYFVSWRDNTVRDVHAHNWADHMPIYENKYLTLYATEVLPENPWKYLSTIDGEWVDELCKCCWVETYPFGN